MNETATAARIAQVYFALESHPLEWIYLTHIRAELADLTRDEQDAALMYLLKGGTVEIAGQLYTGHLSPDSSRARNLPEHVAAAFRGNNWITFQDA